jgi:hypothetical protein
MSELGVLKKQDQTYEFHYGEHGLVIRGAYVEWVLQAAAEVISQTERLRAEGELEELKVLQEMGEAEEIEVDSAQFDQHSRFEVLPQCLVTMGSLDYRWVSPEGRGEGQSALFPAKRIHDMSLTRNDSFLRNEDGVDTTEKP